VGEKTHQKTQTFTETVMRQTIWIPCTDENGLPEHKEVDLESYKAGISDKEWALASELLQYAELQMENPEAEGYWDHLYMCHEPPEVVAEFIRPCGEPTCLNEILISESIALFHKVMAIKEESQSWYQ
jgi:hypothetical protein